MGRRLLIAFIPEKKIVKNLSEIRKISGIKANRKSAPHVTIVDNSYSSLKNVDKELIKIAKSFSPFTAKIEGLSTFEVNKKLKIEKYRKNNSLIYGIKNNRSMNKLRKEVLARLDHLKTTERVEQWIGENPEMPKKSLTNIKKYGTPFGLKEWKFHTTIGLIPKVKQKEILNHIRKLNLEESWKINQFGLFIRKQGWVLYKKYYFR